MLIEICLICILRSSFPFSHAFDVRGLIKTALEANCEGSQASFNYKENFRELIKFEATFKLVHLIYGQIVKAETLSPKSENHWKPVLDRHHLFLDTVGERNFIGNEQFSPDMPCLCWNDGLSPPQSSEL